MKSKITLLLLLATTMLLGSCALNRNVAYLQDMEVNRLYDAVETANPIQVEDRLNISVNSKTAALAIPFNNKVGGFQVGEKGEVTDAATKSTTQSSYLVEEDGKIEFPVLGKIQAAGLTLSELRESIKSRIIAGQYMDDPMVDVEFANFRIYMLGEIYNGSINVTDGKITLLEAISEGNDIRGRGNIRNVTVLRKVGDQRERFEVDMRSKDLFTSPVYNLQQNDIVYVIPRYRKRDAESNILYYLTLPMSLIITVASIVSLTK